MKVLIFGATGMVGEGVLRECLPALPNPRFSIGQGQPYKNLTFFRVFQGCQRRFAPAWCESDRGP